MKRFLFIIYVFSGILLFDYLLIFIPYKHPKYDYLYGFKKFHEKAKLTKGDKRIILMGGSSLGWGVSSSLLSKKLDYLTLNSGIQWGLGYKKFIHNIEDVIDKKNDIIVISPEYEIFSLPEKSQQYCFMQHFVVKTYKFKCSFYLLNYLFSKPNYFFNKNTSEYTYKGFNKYGDFIYRNKKIKPYKIEKRKFDFEKNFNDLKYKYIPYIESLTQKGYEIIYIPNIIPIGSTFETYTYQAHKELHNKFGVNNAPLTILKLDSKYFYDSDYHLTKEGVLTKTKMFESHIKKYLKNRNKINLQY